MGFYPTLNRKFQKNSKKIQKIRKHNHSFFPSQNRLGKAEIERKKKIVPMCSNPTRNKKFQRNNKKIQKIRKHYHSFFPSQTKLGMAEKEKK